jgi:hypothetical protein
VLRTAGLVAGGCRQHKK